MNDILNTILINTYSLNQLKHRLRLLKSNLVKTFFGGEDSTPPSSPQDFEWLKSLPASFYQKFNKDNVSEIFSNLEQEIVKLPTLTLYLTIEPDESTLEALGTFARKTYGSLLSANILLLDIRFDPNLVAGTALVWKGVYKDYSLRAKIEGKKMELASIFKQFLR